MSEETSEGKRWKSVLVQCGVGLYGAIGGVYLARFGGLIILFQQEPRSSWLAQWFASYDSTWIVNFGLWVLAATLVAVWLDFALGARRLWARLSGALVFGIFLFRATGHSGWWSTDPMSWWSRPATKLIAAATVSILVLALLPAVRRFWPLLKPKSFSFGRILVYLLPLLAMLPAWSFNIAMRAKMRPLGERVSQVQLPVPPGAESAVERDDRVWKTLTFTLRERYPAATAARFYQQHFTAEGWHQDYQSDWTDGGGYSPRGSQATMSYLQGWNSPDGVLRCLLSIEYQTPWGTDPRLPLAEWQDDWLEVQDVTVAIMPREPPFGPG